MDVLDQAHSVIFFGKTLTNAEGRICSAGIRG